MSAIVHSGIAPRWRPAPLVLASVAVHLAALALAVIEPDHWMWAVGAIVANHALLTTIVMWPRSTLLGPNIVRLPAASAARNEVALTFDDGPDPELTPRVLDILESHGVRATFFCIAEKAARHPDLAHEIVRRGHAIENHSNAHEHTFAFLMLGGLRRDVGQAQSTILALTGTAPRFFRPPMGFRNPFLDPVLHDQGLKLVSWTRRGYDTNPRHAATVAQRLENGLAAGDILLLHDGCCAVTPAGVPVVLEVLPRLLDRLHERGLKPVTLRQAIDP